MYRFLAFSVLLASACAGHNADHHAASAPSPASTPESSSATPTEAEAPEGGLALTGGEASPKRRIGRLPKEAVRDAIHAEHPRIQACYHSARERKPGLAGRLVLRFAIAEDGGVEELTIRDDSTVLDIPMRECILDIFRKLEFPKPEGGIVLVSYPFEFEMEASGATPPRAAPQQP